MTTFLLSVHVVVAIIAIGPVTVAASMYAPAVRAALSDPGDSRAVGVVRTLHRICNVYAAIGILVPIFGFATAASMDVLGDPWLVASIALTAVAAVLLAVVILPTQQQLLAGVDPDRVTPEQAATEQGATEQGVARVTTEQATTEQTTAERATPEQLVARTKRLAMTTGMFGLLWTVVTVLMIARPGSTTGA